MADALQLIPNPAITTFSLSTNNKATDISKVKIMDVNGRLVREIQSPGTNQPISIEELSKGMYLVNFTDANGFTASKKLIVK